MENLSGSLKNRFTIRPHERIAFDEYSSCISTMAKNTNLKLKAYPPIN
ncbi:MAG: hypothetical protein KJ578_13730 [Bacteroidetes bacterium]|nr:hypothetical protein [Bacteroidota bacterium]MBU1580987.1 hypothetical protein [Bacteroidota bacterium]MBU2558832.1 hypothetical protein [Bacteroidota bacterium]